MIIKLADDKKHQITVLQNLLIHPSANLATKKRIEQELRNIQAGIRGEDEAAYEMKVHYGDSLNWMIIHDLRIEQGGLVAQIDHLIMNRWLEMWVCESKHFSEGIAINEHGEFAVSVITQFDALLVTLCDGRCGKDLQQNGTGIATGAVLALGG